MRIHFASSDSALLKKHLYAAKPFPHLVLPGFLPPQQVKQLLAALKREPFYEKRSDLFQIAQTADLSTARQPLLKQFRDELCGKEFISFMSAVSGIKLKSGVIDCNGSLYQDGDYLLCHDDELEGRKIAFLLYLTDLTPADGGALALLGSAGKKPTKTMKRIIPQAGTLAFFIVSPKSFHEVEEVIGSAKRYAIGGWLLG